MKKSNPKRSHLQLSKTTIANLNNPEMTKVIGGAPTYYCATDYNCTRACPATVTCAYTLNGKTCKRNCY